MSSKKLTPANPTERMHGDWKAMHGFKGKEEWIAPRLATFCNKEARPGYETKLAHEYLDDPEVLAEKVTLLASFLKQSNFTVLYTGAGLSTSAGIPDYATKAENGLVKKQTLGSNLLVEPSLSHRAMVELYNNNLVHGWVQQNHDGLPQKAGLPQHVINEIHGSWFDPSNTVVPMSGSLRTDLVGQLEEWEEKAQVTLSVGTSMCGMWSDEMFTAVAKRGLKGKAVGGVIINLQQTQYDHLSALRIFAKIDDVSKMLLRVLGLSLPLAAIPYKPQIPASAQVEQNLFKIPHTKSGKVLSAMNKAMLAKPGRTQLDLRQGAKVKITQGPYAGDVGVVDGRNTQGHYVITFTHNEGKNVKKRTLGSWWVEGGVKGMVAMLPVVNIVKK